MTYAPKPGVQGARVLAVQALEGAGKRVVAMRDGDQVDVVGHQAVAQDRQAVVPRVIGQEIEVELVVFGPEKGLLTIVAALRDVVRQPGDDESRRSGHTLK
jgi:hypothetical protein